MSSVRIATLCGDCGDELIGNPDKGEAHAVTVEVSPRIFQHTWVYDKPAYLHADDRTPICSSRADAIVRKPELLARYYPGGTEAHPELVTIMAGHPDLAALVEAS